MKRFTFALSAAVAALLVSTAGAQMPIGNNNDHHLQNGIDFIYGYSVITLGPGVGTSGVPDYGTNDFFWKVFSKDTLRDCDGVMDATGMEIWVFDDDFTAIDIGGMNTALADYHLTTTSAAVPVNCGQLEPDQAAGTLITFGATTSAVVPGNNASVPDPGCPPAGFINGYRFEVDTTNGAGPGFGIPVVADGLTDMILTCFIPGLGDGTAGTGTCGTGDAVSPDAHSGIAGGDPGETQYDLIGCLPCSLPGAYSAFGGYGQAGVLGGTDVVKETASNGMSFAELNLAMMVDSNAAPPAGLEEGLASVHFNWTGAGALGKLGARVYGAQALNPTTGASLGGAVAILGTLTSVPVCVNFLGTKLGLNATDILWPVFQLIWPASPAFPIVYVNDDNAAIPIVDAFDDGQYNPAATFIGPKPGAIPACGGATINFQAFWNKPGPGWLGSQITKLTLHG